MQQDIWIRGIPEPVVLLWKIEGEVAKPFASCKYAVPNLTVSPPKTGTEINSDKCLYGGGLHVLGHHGHMLLESLGRFYVFEIPERMAEITTIVFTDITSNANGRKNVSVAEIGNCRLDSTLPKQVKWILTMLRAFPLTLDKRLVYICQSTLLKHVDIPDNRFEYPQFYEPNTLPIRTLTRIYEVIRSKYSIQNQEKRLYLSRSGTLDRDLDRIKKGLPFSPWERVCLNERELESQLQSLGIEIVHLELLTLEKQIALISSASLIVGFEGTNMHNSIFLNSGQVVVLSSCRTDFDMIGQTQLNMCHPSTVKFTLIKLDLKPGHPGHSFTYNVDIEEVLDKLRPDIN
jgi:hypothetical protein